MCFQAVYQFETTDLQKLTHFEMIPWSSHIVQDAVAGRETRKLLTPKPDEPERNSFVIRRHDNGSFSIAAGVKGDLLTSWAFLHFIDLRGPMSPDGALASLRGRHA